MVRLRRIEPHAASRDSHVRDLIAVHERAQGRHLDPQQRRGLGTVLHHYLAVVEHGRGELEEATAHASRAVESFTRKFAADHPRVADARDVARVISASRARGTGQLSVRA